MGKMTVEAFVEELKNVLGSNLVSVVLYGSAAAGDHTGALSDTNLLGVTQSLGSSDLDRASGPVSRWVKTGNPPPVFFTENEIRRSADVFPIEFADLTDARRVLYGKDVFKGLVLSKTNLRSELEHEFRSKLLQLRARYLIVAGNDRRVRDLMLQSVSTFLVLMKAMVRLYGEKPPLKKVEALTILRARFDFDDGILRTLDQGRVGASLLGDPKTLFSTYLSALEEVVGRIDGKPVVSGKRKASRSKR